MPASLDDPLGDDLLQRQACLKLVVISCEEMHT